MKNILVLAMSALLTLTACAQERSTPDDKSERSQEEIVKDPKRSDRVVKSEQEWKAELTKEQYYILREHGTERAFTGQYWDNKKEGVYHCAACELPLYSSEAKFRSGTGWPSFYQAVSEDALVHVVDRSWGVRTELRCARCDGHLGHIFKDAYDQPTGLRHCINSAALEFVPTKDQKKESTRKGE